MSAKHTPGRWEVDRTGKYYKPCIRMNGVIVALLPDNSAGLVIGQESAKEADEANARLIAAAPELLEALKGVVPGSCPIVTHHRPDCHWCAALRAIARVEGGQS